MHTMDPHPRETRARKVLVVGSGGREHALAWRLSLSPGLQTVIVAPGNPGTARERELKNFSCLDIERLAEFAAREHVDFTVVGPEAPLAAGIVDHFRAQGLKIFGPCQAAAQLESSKDFAKRFMQRHGIPTAAFQTFTDAAAARAYISAQGAPIVVKADGLAAGKGVLVADTVAAAHAFVDRIFAGSIQAASQDAARVVIEEFLTGEEVSFIVLADGKSALPLASSQDHKRLYDNDQGPNTGGMGAYSPAPAVTPAMHARIMREVIDPTLRGMAADGLPYTGFLYAGLMILPDGSVRVLEYNCRLGDPETQPIMMRMKSDFSAIIAAAIDGRLDSQTIDWDWRAAVGVVLAAPGYPDAPLLGTEISGLPERQDETAETHIFYAGVSEATANGPFLTAGGRVLCVTALGDTLRQAQSRAYERIAHLNFAGMQFRRDIGHRGIKREK